MTINITDVNQTPVENESTWITQGANVLEQLFLAQANANEIVMNVNVTMTLTDGQTVASTTFKVTYLAEVIPEVPR